MIKVKCITISLSGMTFEKEYDVVEYIPDYKFYNDIEIPVLKIINDWNIERIFAIKIWNGEGWIDQFQDVSPV